MASATAIPQPTPTRPAALAATPDAGSQARAPGGLRETQRDLVRRVLQACGGNVSAAARQLGVSRGLVYRHRGGAG